MGHASEAAERFDLEAALRWHLTYNHYPPVPDSMISPCRAAIEAASRGDWEREIALPSGVLYRDPVLAPVWAIESYEED